MRFTVTGATGFVGNNLVRALLDGGHEVRVTTRPSSDLRALDGLDVEQLHGDLTDPEFVSTLPRDVDGVFHCAAMIWIGRTKVDLSRRVNVEPTCNLAEACRVEGVRMIHVSSVDALASARNKRAQCDESNLLPRKPDCAYTVSKRESEACVMRAVDRGLNATVVNPSFMVGPYDWAPSSGKMMLSLAGRFVPFTPGGGVSVADVRDVASGIIAAYERGRVGERYILAGHNVTYLHLWRLMAKVTGSPRPWLAMGSRVARLVGIGGDAWRWLSSRESLINSAALRMGQLYHYYDSGKAMAELNYATRPLLSALEDSWRWLRQQQPVAAV
ncbi:MAG: NAD-dependent epimerase/dehydratase family protein [Planctomycetales bacterium]|nr:NAD-dependent epimerase/dehydratase family protein [Planctomycetales bacterium]